MGELTDALTGPISGSLELEDVTPRDIDTDAPLRGGGLGLDSVGALEPGVAIKGRYGGALAAVSGETHARFRLVRLPADLIRARP